MEKRLIDVSNRAGGKEFSQERWKGYLDIKQSIEQTIGRSIYNNLPGVIENIFGSNLNSH